VGIFKMNKKDARLKRGRRFRMKAKELEALRLCVHRTSKHMYAQIISADGAFTLAAASTLDKELKQALNATGNKEAATQVGELIAKRALAAGIKIVAFDRSGFEYHGRVKALANAAREHGLQF